MKTLVAIPYDGLNSQNSKDFKPPKIIGQHVETIISYNTEGITKKNKIEFARERLVESLMESDYEKILFVDNDIIVEPDDLLPLIESEHLVAFAIYPYRAQWESEEQIPNYPKEISILQQGGLGTCCIHRDVFTKIEPPYFGRRGRITDWKREDWNFFRNCQRAKINTYVYPDIQIGHQDRETDIIYYFNTDKTKIIRIEGREYADSQTR
jgi:hypothetical protein